QNELAAGRSHPSVARGGRTSVVLADDLYASYLGKLGRIIRRAVVYDDDLVLVTTHRLALQSAQAIRNRLLCVVGGYNNRNYWDHSATWAVGRGCRRRYTSCQANGTMTISSGMTLTR